MIICVVFYVPMIFLGIFLRDHRLGNDQSIENFDEKEKNDSEGNFLKKYLTISNNSKVWGSYIAPISFEAGTSFSTKSTSTNFMERDISIL